MFHLLILTKKKTFFDGEATSLQIAGTIGYMEILQNHASLISSLESGIVQVKDKDGKQIHFAISGGIFEVNKNQATILADTLEPSDSINIERAEDALKKAKDRLELENETEDIHNTMEAILRAKTRIKVYEKSHSDSI